MTDNMPIVKKDKAPSRVEKTNIIVDDEVAKQLSDLELASSDLDAVIEVMTDRVVQSTDVGLAIALARFMEIRLDTFKKRNDIVKTLVSDKSIEVGAKKRQPATDLDSLLSGVSFGAALGATVSTQKSLNQKKADQQKTLPFITVDEDAVDIEFETEHLSLDNTLQKSSIDKAISGDGN